MRMKIGCIVVALMVASITVSTDSRVASLAAAQSGDEFWYSGRREACPPGHRVPVSLAGITLYVDFRWVTSVRAGDVPAPAERCPAMTVEANLIHFYYGYKELAQLYKERELPLSQLILETGTQRDIPRLPFPTFTDKKRAIGSVGFVEDVSDRALFDKRPSILGRAYLFQHLDRSIGDDRFLVVCIGIPTEKPPGRSCDADYFLEPRLIVRYRVRQDARNHMARHWQIPPDGPIEEPDGLLEIDSKVRALIRFFRSEP